MMLKALGRVVRKVIFIVLSKQADRQIGIGRTNWFEISSSIDSRMWTIYHVDWIKCCFYFEIPKGFQLQQRSEEGLIFGSFWEAPDIWKYPILKGFYYFFFFNYSDIFLNNRDTMNMLILSVFGVMLLKHVSWLAANKSTFPSNI